MKRVNTVLLSCFLKFSCLWAEITMSYTDVADRRLWFSMYSIHVYMCLYIYIYILTVAVCVCVCLVNRAKVGRLLISLTAWVNRTIIELSRDTNQSVLNNMYKPVHICYMIRVSRARHICNDKGTHKQIHSTVLCDKCLSCVILV